MTEPTDAEIIALADETRTAEGGASGYILPISFARAVLAKWGTLRAEKIVLHTDTTEQEFQKHYQRGYAAGQKASATQPTQAQAVQGVQWQCGPQASGFTAPQPTQAQAGAVPLTDEQRNAIYDKHCFLGDNGWEIDWWKVIDEVEAAHGIKGGQHGESV